MSAFDHDTRPEGANDYASVLWTAQATECMKAGCREQSHWVLAVLLRDQGMTPLTGYFHLCPLHVGAFLQDSQPFAQVVPE